MLKRTAVAALLGAFLMAFLPGKVHGQQAPCEAPLLEQEVECVGYLEAIPYASASEYISLTNAPQEIRQHLLERETDFSVYVQVWSDQLPTQEQFLAMELQAFYDAMEHTGIPVEGDYLLWHFKTVRYGYGGRYEQQEDGYLFYLSFAYNVEYLTTLQQEEQMDRAVAELLANLSLDGKTEYQKICAIYEYMTNHIIYDYAGLESDADYTHYTAYGALLEGEAVCQGYASLFYRLALSCGVDARLIAGDAEGAHGWNIVGFDGLYYNLDTTWDAANPRYGTSAALNYFLKSPGSFSDHIRNTDYDTEAFHREYPMSVIDYERTMDRAAVHRYSDGLPDAAFDDIATAASLTGEDQYLRLVCDMTDESGTALERNLYLDLNGYDLSADFQGPGVLYILDSSTDGFACYDNAGALSCGSYYGTAENLANGSGERLQIPGTEEIRRYIALPMEGGGWTFHRIYLSITHISLVPDRAALGYKAVFYGDELAAQALESYGYDLWVELDGQDLQAARAEKAVFENGRVLMLRVDRLMGDRDEQNEIAVRSNVQADVFMQFRIGDTLVCVQSTEQSANLRSVLEQVNTVFTALTQQQQRVLRDMCVQFSRWMTGWDISNILA